MSQPMYVFWMAVLFDLYCCRWMPGIRRDLAYLTTDHQTRVLQEYPNEWYCSWLVALSPIFLKVSLGLVLAMKEPFVFIGSSSNSGLAICCHFYFLTRWWMIPKRPHRDTEVNICRYLYLSIDQSSCLYHNYNNFEVSKCVVAKKRPQFYDKYISLVDTLASVTCCDSCEHFPRPTKTTDCHSTVSYKSDSQ